MIAVDNTLLSLLLHPKARPPPDPATGKPVTRVEDRIEQFDRGRQDLGITIATGKTDRTSPRNERGRMKKTKPAKPPSEEYQRFEQFVKELVAVPKSELDRREAEYQRKKVAEKKRKFA